MLQIVGNTVYNQKNKKLMKIPEFKRSGIGIIAEFGGISSSFPIQDHATKGESKLSRPHQQSVTIGHVYCVSMDVPSEPS
jgi:hypothetical protein